MAGQLGADLSDVLHHRVAAAFPIDAPNRLINTLPVKHLPRVEGKQFHDIKFPAGKGHRLTARRDRPGSVVHRQLSEKPRRRRTAAPLFPPQMSLHPGGQLVQVEGLDDIVVRPRPKPFDLVRRLDPRRQKKNRAGNVRPDGPADAQPVHPRHIDIQQYQVRSLPRLAKGLFPAAGGEHVIARGKVSTQHIHNPRLVICDQQLLSHNAAPFSIVRLFCPVNLKLFSRTV